MFPNSFFVRNIEQFGKQIYFPDDNLHIIGDKAFPLSSWLMTPYKDPRTQIQRNHNNMLNADRVCIEHAFGLLKGRWRRLIFINTYSISKAVEIVTPACVLHNFCYLNADLWEEYLENDEFYDCRNPRLDMNFGVIKRDRIAENLM